MNFAEIGSVPGHVNQQHSANVNSTYPEGWRMLPGQDIVVLELTPLVDGDDVNLSIVITDPASNFAPDGTSRSFAPTTAGAPWIVQITELPPRADGSPCDQVDYSVTLTGNGESAPSDWNVAAYA
jgi:hypothetical protein